MKVMVKTNDSDGIDKQKVKEWTDESERINRQMKVMEQINKSERINRPMKVMEYIYESERLDR